MSMRVRRNSLQARSPLVRTTVPSEASGQRSPDRHGVDPSASVVAALISARWTSPCGKLPRNSPRVGVDLFGVEAEIVGQRKQLIHQRDRLLAAVAPRKCLDEPERAGDEAPFSAGQAVLAPVAVEKRAARELLADGVDRSRPAAPRPPGESPSKPMNSRLASSSSSPGRTHVAVALRRPAARVDELADLLAVARHRSAWPSGSWPSCASSAAQSRATQHISFDCVKCAGSARTSQIPASGWRHSLQTSSAISRQPAAGLAVELPTAARVTVRGLEQLAVDVELQLWRGGIADPDRTRAAIAGERQLSLGRASATVEAVEDLEAGMGELRRVQQPREVGVGLRRTAEPRGRHQA